MTTIVTGNDNTYHVAVKSTTTKDAPAAANSPANLPSSLIAITVIVGVMDGFGDLGRKNAMNIPEE